MTVKILKSSVYETKIGHIFITKYIRQGELHHCIESFVSVYISSCTYIHFTYHVTPIMGRWMHKQQPSYVVNYIITDGLSHQPLKDKETQSKTFSPQTTRSHPDTDGNLTKV